MTDQEAVDDYTIDYRGTEVRFCCEECRGEFLREPQKYESNLGMVSQTWWEQVRAFHNNHTQISVIGILLGLLVILRVYRAARRPTEHELRTLFGKALMKPCSATVPLVIGMTIVGYHFRALAMERYDRQIEEDIHYATFYDFGYPPKPKRPPVEPRTSATFYRGNDERNSRLFNNGNYRTATFRISVVDQDGTEVRVGDDAPENLFVEFVIDRPPFTPDFLYEPRFMKTMFLTQECDRFLGRYAPVADRVDLEETDPMQQWRARYPVKGCCAEAKGVIYVCEEYHYAPWYLAGESQRGGARIHYAIQFDLKFDDGKLASGSDMWMGAMYRTRKFRQATVPLNEWFSHEPIPELPAKNVDDLDLLGITDYL